MNSILEFIRKDPVLLFAPIGVLILSATTIYFELEGIIGFMVNMLMMFLLILQWRNFLQMIDKSNQEKRQMELDRLVKWAKEGAGWATDFWVFYHGPLYYRVWNKIRKLKTLAMYKYSEDDRDCSFTKFSVTDKELFEMRLKGYIEIIDPLRALAALKYLEERC